MPTILRAAVELHARAAELREDVDAVDPAALAEIEARTQHLAELLFDAVRGAL